MSIESLVGMFSQRSGADQSMGSSVMSAIVGFLAQKMMRHFLLHKRNQNNENSALSSSSICYFFKIIVLLFLNSLLYHEFL
jgi:hypothetical protein